MPPWEGPPEENTLAANFELKALVEDLASTERLIDKSQVLGVEECSQRDVYLPSQSHLVKLRYNGGEPSSVITYQRAATPRGRPSRYEKIDVEGSQLGKRLFAALEAVDAIGVVDKTRKVFRLADALINLDTVEGAGNFVEIEVSAHGDDRDAAARLAFLASALGIAEHQILPYSNIHMVNIARRAALHRQELRKGRDNGVFVAIDGASASGKTTLKDWLLGQPGSHFDYALRETTRNPRSGDETSQDYVFVSKERFFAAALRGDYAEFRDFEFGMSYGLPWQSFMNSILEGRNVLGLINLGNGPYLKRICPEVVTVLLVADPEVIRSRLQARGALLAEQIEERVHNSMLARGYAPAYDHVIDTGKVGVEDAASLVLSLVARGPSSARRTGRER
jgi:predicted adenylyl cyclase CyaB